MSGQIFSPLFAARKNEEPVFRFFLKPKLVLEPPSHGGDNRGTKTSWFQGLEAKLFEGAKEK